MAGCAERIAHVVQAVEESHKVEILAWLVLGRRHFETGVLSNSMFSRAFHMLFESGGIERSRSRGVTGEVCLAVPA
jgi:hypothetical protein